METPEGAAAPAAPQPLVARVARVAVLDHDGIYWHLEPRLVEAIKPGELVFGDPALKDLIPAGAVYVDRDCDLDGGKYKFNVEKRCFEPLPRNLRKAAAAAPTTDRALYELLKTSHQRDAQSVPEASVEWAIAYEKTLDALDSRMDEAQHFLNYFHAATGRKRK